MLRIIPVLCGMVLVFWEGLIAFKIMNPKGFLISPSLSSLYVFVVIY
jgi:hypothetical protein